MSHYICRKQKEEIQFLQYNRTNRDDSNQVTEPFESSFFVKNRNIVQIMLYNTENTCKIFLTALLDGEILGNY
jgi:hypothetical protein